MSRRDGRLAFPASCGPDGPCGPGVARRPVGREGEKLEEAQRLWERRVLRCATDLQTALIHLMKIAEKEDRPRDADFCAETYEQVSRLLHVAKWVPYIAKFQQASFRKDRQGCLAALGRILPALNEPWEPGECPLYRRVEGGDLTALARSLSDRIREDLEHSEEFAFFRGSTEYDELRPLLDQRTHTGG